MTNCISNHRPRFRGAIAAVAFSTALTFLAQAATFTVTNTNNTGAGSLRAAISEANLTPQIDTIVFSPSLNGQTITLEEELVITEGLIINGPGSGLLTLDGNEAVRIFRTVDATVQINGLALTRARAPSGSWGGAIRSEGRDRELRLTDCVISDSITDGSGGGVYAAGDLVVENCQIIDNTSERSGGGIYGDENVRLTNSAVSGNVAIGSSYDGGGIFSDLLLEVINSQIVGNEAGDDGGGLYCDNSRAYITNSTIADNVAGYLGGGLYGYYDIVITGSTIANNAAEYGGGIYAGNGNSNYEFTLINTTLSGNSAGVSGGGLYRSGNQNMLIAQSTVTANTAGEFGGGVYVDDSLNNVVFQNSIFHNNIILSGTGPDLYFEDFLDIVVADSVNNLIGDDDTTNFVDGVNGNIVNVTQTVLGPLQDNGGPTFTHEPLENSLVINAGENTVVSDLELVTDQRGSGFPRIVNGRVDIGAVEYNRGCEPQSDLNSDVDDDGIPDPVETSEGLNPCAKDNDIFNSSRLFVMQLYRDFLDREADTGGLNHWQGEIDSGRLLYSDMGVAFIFSVEYLAQINERFPGVTDQDELDVLALYAGMLRRDPDQSGFDFWVGRFKDGQPRQALVQAFLDSLEYSCRFVVCN